MTKLSPAMQAAMWATLMHEDGNARYAQLPRELEPARKAWNRGTVNALQKRGLIVVLEPDERWFRATRLTDAGRTWIAQQIIAAHAEALEENHRRNQHTDVPLAEWTRSWSMLVRANLRQTAIQPAIADDHIDAIRERLDRARQVANYMGTDEYHAAVEAAQFAGLFPMTTAA